LQPVYLTHIYFRFLILIWSPSESRRAFSRAGYSFLAWEALRDTVDFDPNRPNSTYLLPVLDQVCDTPFASNLTPSKSTFHVNKHAFE
jgi:hypothetical protein